MRCLVVLGLMLAVMLAAPAEPPREVREQVKRAVDALKKLQRGDGSLGDYGPGSTALAGLALLESGVAKDDPVIQSAANFVRPTALNSQHTYSISLAVVFLDRLGEPNDVALIKMLTERLIAGQCADAGWTYTCPLGDITNLVGKYPQPGPPGRSDAPQTPRRDLSPDAVTRSDNSNSQFAILALWIGHRHEVDVDHALRRVEERYRQSVIRTADGAGWDYLTNGGGPGPATSCCGLLGLAAAAGTKIERRLKSSPEATPPATKNDSPSKVNADSIINEGFRYVIKAYGEECAIAYNPGSEPNLYFLWSVERLAMAFGPSRFGAFDWYRVGLSRILPYQGANGLWGGRYGSEVDTSFALLFLSRSNLTRDLTNLLNPKAATKLKTESKAATPAAPPFSPEAEKLIKEYFSTPVADRPKLLAEYRDKKGVAYTEALAGIIPKLGPDLVDSGRQMLAERLARMTKATLADFLKDADAELRRAAATAAGLKDEKSLIPDLIARLDDDVPIALAAMIALKALTGEAHGPPANPTAEQHDQAVAAWKEWWRKKKP